MTRALLAAALLCVATAGPAHAQDESFVFGSFGKVALYRPQGTPRAVVLFVSDDGGWNLGVIDMARRLRELGAEVAGIDMRTLRRNLEASSRGCAYPAGDFEELSRAVQLRLHLSRYVRPILAGYSSGATLVYAVIAQAPPETFAGAISLSFCPHVAISRPLCGQRRFTVAPRRNGPGFDLGAAKDLAVPWFVLQGEIDQVCDAAGARAFVGQIPRATLIGLPSVGHAFPAMRTWDSQFVTAFDALSKPADRLAEVKDPGAPDIALDEVDAAAGTSSDTLAVLLTGDGGWAEIDKGIAGALAARGIPVLGWSSLEYYWTPRTPDGAARDLAAVIRHYLVAKKKSRVLLAGFSFGADVLPFLASRLPGDLRSRVAGVALIGLSMHAQFEFHVTGWLGGHGDPNFPTGPEVARLKGLPVLCLQGQDDDDSACRGIPPSFARTVVLPGGHHLGGDYSRVGALILDALGAKKP
ncbi:MAG: virulence factor family protein [Vicinamibacteria bacterium]|nr:virulence factor family protein [Vicinamibacteria bacterium]